MEVVEVFHSECIQACQECIVASEVCIAHMTAAETQNDCPNCCRASVAVCNLCIQALAGDWAHSESICRLAADVCMWSAHNCREHANDICQYCADLCERCATACREAAA